MKTSENALDIIKTYESLHDGDLRKIGLQPKECPSGIWTIGFGRALKDINGEWLKGVNGFRRLTEIYPDYLDITVEEANEMLVEDIDEVEEQLASLKLTLKQYQWDSLISLIFNIGIGNFKTSTLLRRINGEKGSIAEAFRMWKYGGGKILPGLVKRRETELTLFIYGTLII